MRAKGIVGFAIAAVVLSVTLSGCSSSPRFGGVPDGDMPADAAYEEHLDEQRADQAARQAELDAEREPPAASRDFAGPSDGTWKCVYSATWNDDWHDDVLCSNGYESHRPYLRASDNFVEEWEIMEAAAQYEAELNAGG